MARTSAVFEHAIAASSRTAPSHASLMTSRWVGDHSIGYLNGKTRLTTDTTLAEIFRANGYETAAFIGNTVIRSHTGLDRGFGLYDQDLPEAERNRPGHFERTAADTTERAIEWLDRERQEPYFIWVHYQDPHGPYTPPHPWDAGLEVPSIPGEGPLPRLEGQRGPGGVPAYQWLPGNQATRRYRSLYAGEIRHFDAWLGRLAAAVSEASRTREVIWVVTADHGESLGEDDVWFSHGQATTPNLTHIPLLIRSRGMAPGRISGLVHHVDVMPTLLSLAGLSVPEGLRGIDLSQTGHHGQTRDARVVFSDIGEEVSAYAGDGFLRARVPGRAAKTGDNRLTQHRWLLDGATLPGPGNVGIDWVPDPDGSAIAHGTREALEAYLSRAPPMVSATPPDEEQRARLRALGYLDPAN
jgi:arylsulfatase